LKIRTLLADDEKGFVETLSERLRTRGFHVTEAFSGEDALEERIRKALADKLSTSPMSILEK